MRSLIKLYDMYKAGEYIRDFNNTKMDYLRKLEEIQEPTRTELMRLDDKLSYNKELYLTIALFLMLGLGIALGYIMGYSYQEMIYNLKDLIP